VKAAETKAGHKRKRLEKKEARESAKDEKHKAE